MVTDSLDAWTVDNFLVFSLTKKLSTVEKDFLDAFTVLYSED
jgi:hypothetical protein